MLETSTVGIPCDTGTLDQPAILDVERVVPGTDLDLAVCIRLTNDAVVYGFDDFFLRMRPVFHERAAHARHWRILVGLAPAGAGRLQVVLLRTDLVVQV